MLGSRSRPVSRQALLRAARPKGSSSEWIWHQAFDTQTYVSAATTTLDFYAAVNSDKTLSNMEAAGQFTSPQVFSVHNVCADFIPVNGVSTSADRTGNLNDLNMLLMVGRATWTLSYQNKAYGPYSLSALHGTGGPTGFGWSSDGAEILQFAKNDPSGGWNYFGDLVIQPQTGFQFRINWAAAQTLTGNVLIRISLFGFLNRAVR